MFHRQSKQLEIGLRPRLPRHLGGFGEQRANLRSAVSLREALGERLRHRKH
jgi:hypothetical protein